MLGEAVLAKDYFGEVEETPQGIKPVGNILHFRSHSINNRNNYPMPRPVFNNGRLDNLNYGFVQSSQLRATLHLHVAFAVLRVFQ